MDRALSNLLPFFILAMVIGLVSVFAFWLRRRVGENLTELAARLGLQVQPQPPTLGIFPRIPQVEGFHQGRSVRFYSYGKNYGENRVTFSVVAARHRGREDFVLLVNARPDLRRWFSGPQLERVLTEEMDFDKSFPAKSNDPATAKELLTPEIRNQITTARWQKSGPAGRLKVEKGEVSYTIRGSFASRRRIEYLVEQLPLVCGLARLMENRR